MLFISTGGESGTSVVNCGSIALEIGKEGASSVGLSSADGMNSGRKDMVEGRRKGVFSLQRLLGRALALFGSQTIGIVDDGCCLDGADCFGL
jgi:hypothetical protein